MVGFSFDDNDNSNPAKVGKTKPLSMNNKFYKKSKGIFDLIGQQWFTFDAIINSKILYI